MYQDGYLLGQLDSGLAEPLFTWATGRHLGRPDDPFFGVTDLPAQVIGYLAHLDIQMVGVAAACEEQERESHPQQGSVPSGVDFGMLPA